MLELGRRVLQRLVGLFHGRGHDGAAAGLDACDPVENGPCSVRVHLADPEGLAFEGEHADLVVGPQQLDGRPGGLLGHLDLLAAHRARLVDHQHHRQARLFLLLLEVAADRQDLFERRLVVAAQAERLVAAEHDQAAAQVLHVRAMRSICRVLSAVAGTFERIKQLVVLQLGQGVGHALRRPDVDLHVPARGPTSGAWPARGRSRPAARAACRAEDQAASAVVVEQRVFEAGHAGRELGQALGSIVGESESGSHPS